MKLGVILFVSWQIPLMNLPIFAASKQINRIMILHMLLPLAYAIFQKLFIFFMLYTPF